MAREMTVIKSSDPQNATRDIIAMLLDHLEQFAWGKLRLGVTLSPEFDKCIYGVRLYRVYTYTFPNVTKACLKPLGSEEH